MKNTVCLPEPKILLQKAKSLALLDAIYCQEWEFRYFSHNAHWANNEQMGSMRDGEGNDYFVHFSPNAVAIKGCFIESGISGHPNILKNTHSLMPAHLMRLCKNRHFPIVEI